MPDYLDYPFHIDRKGRAASTPSDDHIRDMIRQVVFTGFGERINRPDFGCGLRQLLFMPNSDALAAATQFLVHSALVHWLGDVIRVERVGVSAVEERLVVEVVYQRLDTGERRREEFVSATGPGSTP